MDAVGYCAGGVWGGVGGGWVVFFFFFFNDTATTEIYTLSLHDALPIWPRSVLLLFSVRSLSAVTRLLVLSGLLAPDGAVATRERLGAVPLMTLPLTLLLRLDEY